MCPSHRYTERERERERRGSHLGAKEEKQTSRGARLHNLANFFF